MFKTHAVLFLELSAIDVLLLCHYIGIVLTVMQYLCMLIDASNIVVCLYSKNTHKHF